MNNTPSQSSKISISGTNTSTTDDGTNNSGHNGMTIPIVDVVENQYLKQEQMMEEIAQQVKQQQSLTSTLLPTSCLRQQYADNPNFIVGINILEQSYHHIRTIRGDGNCYYRAFLYSLLETLIRQQQQQQQQPQQQQHQVSGSSTSKTIDGEGQRLLKYVTTKSWEDILQQNYDEVAIEIFHDEMMELFDDVIVKQIYNEDKGSSNDPSALFHDKMNEENSVSDYCTWYLRLITATYMKQDPDRFLPFLLSIVNNSDDNFDMEICDIHQFCSKYIEPMGQECEHVQVLALAEAFQIHVTVVYLDGHQSQKGNMEHNSDSHLQHHHFGPDTSSIKLTLLYRPGHYDILYKM